MKLKIYMKSGNSFTQRFVKSYKVRCRGNEVTAISLQYKKLRFGCSRLIFCSLNLDQIEAIVKS
jgi:hypothetical protein